jgi:anti-sigma factor RsiW
MSSPLSHDEVEALLGVYALDAVDPDEAEAVEAHLRECPRCRAEVAAHREVAALLANDGASVPEGGWARISAALEEPPPQLGLAPVVPIRRGRRAVLAGVGAAVAGLVAVVALLGVQVARLDHRVSQLQKPLPAFGVQQAALAALLDPRAHQVVLRSDGSADTAQAVILPDGQAYLVRAHLPPLAPNQTYQLWGVVGGSAKVSLGLLGRAPTVTGFRMDPSKVSLLAITAEDAGGVVSSNHSPVVSGPVATTH